MSTKFPILVGVRTQQKAALFIEFDPAVWKCIILLVQAQEHVQGHRLGCKWASFLPEYLVEKVLAIQTILVGGKAHIDPPQGCKMHDCEARRSPEFLQLLTQSVRPIGRSTGDP